MQKEKEKLLHIPTNSTLIGNKLDSNPNLGPDHLLSIINIINSLFVNCFGFAHCIWFFLRNLKATIFLILHLWYIYYICRREICSNEMMLGDALICEWPSVYFLKWGLSSNYRLLDFILYPILRCLLGGLLALDKT